MAGVEEDDVKLQYSASQPPTASSPAAQFHTRLPRPLQHSTAELSSSLPFGLDSMPPAHRLQQLQQHDQGRLLQHCHSLPSSPRKLHPQLPMRSSLCAGNVCCTGSFSDVSYNMATDRTPTNRSKILPKEVAQDRCPYLVCRVSSSVPY